MNNAETQGASDQPGIGLLTATLTLAGVLLLPIGLVGCGKADQPIAQAKPTPPALPAPVVKAKPDHYFVAKDGLEYGYPSAISATDQQGGQVAPKVVMFRYAGEREGKHQVHTSDGTVVTALECSNPCELVKSMSFVDADYLRDTVKVERFQNQEGSIAYAVFHDAIAGKLHQYGMERGGKAYQVWVEEKRGYRQYSVAHPKP